MSKEQNIKNSDKRIKKVLNYVLEIASGDYEAHLELSELEDDLDVIIYGLTNFKDELQYRGKKRDEAEQGLKELNKTLGQEVSARTSELEKSNKELEEFAYIASHDLKAPLINLQALLGMIDIGQFRDEESKDLFKKVTGAISKLHTTVFALNDIIAFKDRLRDNKEQMNFEEVFNDIREGISEQLEIAQATISMDFSQCEVIDYPPLHLRSIIQNVVTNAVKYKHPNKPLEVEVRTERSNGSVCFIVKDNGLGFNAKRDAKKVTGLFKRLHTHVEGKGVGMYIVSSIVDSHGGKIEIESAPNKGTTIKIHLNR